MKNTLRFLSILIFPGLIAAQPNNHISVMPIAAQQKVIIKVNDQSFAEFLYPDTLEKPLLFDIHAADGQIVTRGFPLKPRPGEPVDHPHHVGLWLNYEKVNGLDFWNNSFAIPANQKKLYGWIRTTRISQVKSGNKGELEYHANWTDINKQTLLEETTRFEFSAQNNERIIDRITTLTAVQDIFFADSKDGLLGFRVAHELELPSAQPKTFTDDKGNSTAVPADSTVSGNYLNSEGLQGDSAWGKRAVWCMMFGMMHGDSMSILIIDHPKNPGFPAYWHARGYGLFAVNPLGQQIFSNGRETLNFSLKKGENAVFRYRIVIASGKKILTVKRISDLAATWAKVE